jgi:predicted PurR-regulated permease PerM
MENGSARRLTPRELTNTIVRVGVLVLLAAACIAVLAPFAALILWALILSIALYPLQRALARRLGGRQGAAAALIVVLGLVGIGTPTILLGGSFAGHVQEAYLDFQNDTLGPPEPNPAVADWPLIGPQLYDTWTAAAEDLPSYLAANKPQLQKAAVSALSAAASTAGSVALFLAALVVAAIMMAYGESGSEAMKRFLCRLSDPERGVRLQRLSTATVRSVASGVIGVAFIQALLLGVGLLMAGVPGAGILAFVALIIGIMQLPALLVSLPAIGYLWWGGDASTIANVLWSAYLLLAGMVDNVLKPLLLGRGVEAPMPVILIGALGGMVWSGMIGLFVGAVLLAVGYQLLVDWVADSPGSTVDEANAAPTLDQHV